MTKAPDRIETSRLILRRPVKTDADEIFLRYASDPEVTRYVGFRIHHSIEDASSFLDFSDVEWEQGPAGPYLMRSRTDSRLLGSTGLTFESPYRAMTGYVLAKDSWGKGYATEALTAMIDVARMTRVKRLYALCHVDHLASAHALEKCGFVREGILRSYMEFPNLSPVRICDVFCYALIL